MKNYAGFTVVELLVTIFLAGVLVTLAVPAFFNMIQNQRATTQANNLVTAINVARSEANRRGLNVEICAADAAQDDCAGTAVWEGNGWLVQEEGSGDVIRVWDAPGTGIRIDADGTDRLVFRSNGELDGGGTTTINLNPVDCSGDQQRVIRVNAAGRPSVRREDC